MGNSVEKILQLGPGTLLTKVEIKHVYRNIPIHPADTLLLLGIVWNGGLHIDMDCCLAWHPLKSSFLRS